MTKAEQHLERPVSFTTAVKKLATLRGHYSREGGWIYNQHGKPLCQGWDTYGRRYCMNLVVQDTEHNGGNGKWYVWVIGLDADQLALAEKLWGRKPAPELELEALADAGRLVHIHVEDYPRTNCIYCNRSFKFASSRQYHEQLDCSKRPKVVS